MNKYLRSPTAKEFLDWAKKNPEDWEMFFADYVLDRVFQAEAEDFFGTEGFDKRYG